ncbi:hypothetical protein CAAU_2262 [Caloramator australicus RC3]|uniref:Uncharacterized protein n=1 Tax=Caloramator australicus RC3 TaxID=857293 RepID=I7LHW6_9CLOT|nr:hypothetical protein CAAU_2262 [Caloramator australicus RC3]
MTFELNFTIGYLDVTAADAELEDKSKRTIKREIKYKIRFNVKPP